MKLRDYQAALLVMISLALGNISGLARQVSIADILGVGRFADIYLIAFSIPEFVIVALPIILTPVIIPIFSQIRIQNGDRSAWQWGLHFSKRVLLFLLAGCILAGLSAKILIPWIAPGFSAIDQEMAVQTFYRMLPGLFLMGASVLMGSFLQVYRKFARPVLIVTIYNLVFILALFFLPLDNPLYRAGWGVTLGALAALVFLLPFLWQFRSERLSPSENTYSIHEIPDSGFRLTMWMAAGYGIHHLIYFVDRALATYIGEGGVAVLNYSFHIALIVSQLSGLAIAIVIFPDLSEKVWIRELTSARKKVSDAILLVWGLALPAAMGIVLLRKPIVQVLFEHGAFTKESTQVVSSVMAIYALAAIADALCQPLWRVVYAKRNGKVVFAINGIQTFIRVILNLLLYRLFWYNGLALSAVIGLLIQLILLGIFTQKNLSWNIPKKTLVAAGKILIAASITFIFNYLILNIFENSGFEPLPILILIVIGILFLMIYFILIMLLLRNFIFTHQ